MEISWSEDHAVEGAQLAEFVDFWRGYLEVCQRLIGDIACK